MARRAILVLLLVAPALASGQTATGSAFTVTETNDQDTKINIAECDNQTPDGLVFTWNIPNFTVAGTFTLIASDQANCPTGSGSTAHNVTVADGLAASTASGQFPQSGSVAVSTLLGQISVNCSGTSTAAFFCVNYTASGVVNTNVVTGSIQLDLARPPPPVINNITPGDSALKVSWSPGSGSSDAGTLGTSNGYRIEATSQLDGAEKHTQTVTGGTDARIEGLTNGTTYDVVLIAISPGGNESDPSPAVPGTPVVVEDFWRLYRADGGRETGGCASGAAGLVALLALLPLWARRRRRRS